MIETNSVQLTEVVVPAVSYRMGVSQTFNMGSEEKRNDRDEKRNENKKTYLKELPGARYGLWRCLYIQGWDCDLCQPLVAKEVMNLFQMVSK